jgi:hypothetical protein
VTHLLKLRKTIWASLVLALFYAPIAVAQVPITAGYTPEFKANLGYSYVNAGVPSQSHLAMTGVDGGYTMDLKPRFGLEIDLGYVRNFHAYGTDHSASIFSYMGGPVFHAVRGRRLDASVHALLGAALESGVNFGPNGELLHGYVNKFAWAAGGAVEYKFDEAISLRIGADYMHTAFFTPDITITGQSNLRTTIGVSYRFGRQRP